MSEFYPAPVRRADEVKFCPFDLKQVDMEGTFEGYASLFNRQDMGRDVVLPGAFRSSIAKRGAGGVRMLFQHDPAMPIGVWQRLYEDARGLFVRGRIMTEVAKGREVLSLMRAGALDGLSIGFRAEEGARDRRTGVRRLKAIDLWEISIVTFPMLSEARVSKVKASAAPRRLPTEREFERWLTQDAGFTRSQARAVMRSGLKGLDPMRDAGESPAMQQVLATRFAEAARLIRTSNGRSSL
jgi:HK97 family phage prohead protease